MAVKEFIADFTLNQPQGQNVEFNLAPNNTIDANFSVAQEQGMSATFELLQAAGNDKHFVFEQGISSDTWTITHNLSKHPSITIVDEYERVIPGFAAEYIDNNTVIVRFNAAFKGKAYLN